MSNRFHKYELVTDCIERLTSTHERITKNKSTLSETSTPSRRDDLLLFQIDIKRKSFNFVGMSSATLTLPVQCKSVARVYKYEEY